MIYHGLWILFPLVMSVIGYAVLWLTMECFELTCIRLCAMLAGHKHKKEYNKMQDLKGKTLVAKEACQLGYYIPSEGDRVKGSVAIHKGQRLYVKDHGFWDDPKNGMVHDLTLEDGKGGTIYVLYTSKTLDITDLFKLGRKTA